MDSRLYHNISDLNPAPSLLNPQRRFRLESTLLLILACLFILLSHQQQWFNALDRVLYDATLSRMQAPLDTNTVIVGIDDNALHTYGPWPWNRALQAQLLEHINVQRPQRVTLDIIYSGTTALDQALVKAARASPWLALPLMVESTGQGQQHIEVLPFPDLLDTADFVGHVHIELDDDAIARGTYLYQGVGQAHWPHLMIGLAQHSGAAVPPSCAKDQPQSLFLTKCGYLKFAFAGPAGSYPQISAAQLLDSDADRGLLRQALRGKNVLVGLTASGTGDWVTTPLSGDTGPISGVEFNANLYAALVHNATITTVPNWLQVLIAMAIVALCSLLLPRLRPTQMLATTAALALAPLLSTIVLLHYLSLHLPLANTTVAVILIYPLWSWRRHEIAWRFINTELTRIDQEQAEWALTAGHQHWSKDRYAVLNHLSKLLNAELVIEPTDGPDITIQAIRKAPLSQAEQNLLDVAAAQYFAPQKIAPGLPGEMLAAQIQRLNQRAAEVREGRAMGVAGLGRMSNGVIILSAFGEIRFMNEAAQGLLQVDREALTTINATLAAVQPPLGQSWDDISRQVVLHGKPVYFEGHSPNGTPIFVSAESLGQERQQEFSTLWVITLADLSAIRAAEAQREEALAFLSHDIRSPLVSVLALIRGADEQTQLLADIERYTQKGLATSEQFLQLSRLQLQSSFERYELALEEVIHNAIEQVFVLSKDKQMRFSLSGSLSSDDQGDGTWIMGNGELLERAFVNLFSNAIKYSTANSTIELDVSVARELATVRISDQGYGIPAGELEHIFDPFFRSAEPQLAQHRGAGLGLRFVKTVIDRHQGHIEVESTWGQGSQFTITLPCLADLHQEDSM